MKQYYILISIFFIGLFAFAQDGSVDTSIGQNGLITFDFTDDDQVYDIIEISNGNMMISVDADIDGTTENVLVKLSEDGEIDTAFGTNGIFMLPSNISARNFVDFQDTGRILMPAFLEDENLNVLMAINESGNLDTTFGEDGFVNISGSNLSYTYKALNDGFFISSLVDSQLIIRKFNLDAELDTSYGTNGAFNLSLSEDISFRPTIDVIDGTIYANAIFGAYGTYENRVFKISSSGTFENSFGLNGFITLPVGPFTTCGIKLLRDGSFLNICRTPNDTSNNSDDYTQNTEIFKRDSQGNLMTGFAGDGSLNIFTFSGGVSEQPNGRLLALGFASPGFEGQISPRILRFTSGGYVDDSFSASFLTSELYGLSYLLHSNEKIYVLSNNAFFNPPIDTNLYRLNNSPLSVEENPLQDLTIYPNPSTRIFNIKSETLIENTPFQITDISGKIIQTGILKATETTIDLSNTANGLYFLNAGGTSIKLVKQ